MLNACEIDKQHVHVILRDNVRNKKKENGDMKVPSVGCVSHTSAGCTRGSAVTHSAANTRKVEVNVAIAYAE